MQGKYVGKRAKANPRKSRYVDKRVKTDPHKGRCEGSSGNCKRVLQRGIYEGESAKGNLERGIVFEDNRWKKIKRRLGL